MIVLRPHQQDAFNNVTATIVNGNGSAVGRVVMPTGGGKTFVEAAVLDFQRTSNAKTKIHLVLAPRILLANQLIGEYRNFSGASYRAIAFHSGKHEVDYDRKEKITWKEKATTDVSEVTAFHSNAVAAGQDLVVFSTYHSAHKLIGIDFDTVIADESQYCVEQSFNKTIKALSSRVKLFFTATEKHTKSSSGSGLNNTSVFGERLYYISPATLIQLGLIVAPRLHVMYGSSKDEDRSVVSEIIELARAQHEVTVRELGFSKILFAMKGTADVAAVEANITKIRTEFPSHDIFTITSKKNGARINNVPVKREQFLEKLAKAKSCLIFHYDILSEGIDVDGITGVALLRNMGLAKLLQTIGRAVRVYKANPAAKKWALISVGAINGVEDDKENVKYHIEAIRNGGFDISKEDVIETGKPRHAADKDNVADAYGDDKNMFSKLFSIEGIFHEIESEEFFDALRAAPDTDAQLDLLFG